MLNTSPGQYRQDDIIKLPNTVLSKSLSDRSGNGVPIGLDQVSSHKMAGPTCLAEVRSVRKHYLTGLGLRANQLDQSQ